MEFGSSWQRPGQLPAELTSFVGRAGELAEVARLLGQVRLLTLAGPGGVGKTRLALRAAAGAGDAFADGVRLLELSALRGPELLPDAVADALGLPQRAGQSRIDAVVDHVADRELLLVLDTCEHLVDACALLVDLLLSQAPGLRILATSRQALDIPGEHVLPVSPLGLAEDDGGGDALELFEQRAAAAVPGIVFTDEERQVVAALCRRLDGIPLAIELTAVRLRALPLEQLAVRLTESFALLDGGRKAVVPRHQTLRTAVGWSHQLCSPEERLLWARLSVFAGDFDLAAVEAVCTDLRLPTGAVVDPLIGLVDKSVVLRMGNRYRLLDVIREFGAEWLEQLDETAALRHRLIAYFRSRLQHFEQRFFTSEQVALHIALLPEHGNLRGALEFAHADGDLLPLAAAMWPYWLCAGRPAEARHWIELALAERPEPSEERIGVLLWATTFAVHEGDPGAAHGFATALRDQAAELGRPRLIGQGHMCLGLAAACAGEYEEAARSLNRALDRFNGVGTDLDVALTRLRLGIVHALNGRADDALCALREVLRSLGEQSEESYVQGIAHGFMAVAHIVADDMTAAEQAARQALTLHDSRADVLSVTLSLDMLAWAAAAQRRHRRAALLFGGADALVRLLGRGRALGNAQLVELHEQALTEVQEALGEKESGLLRDEGARLSREQMVAFARSDHEVVPAVPVQPKAPTASSLTQREREVAQLVAQGMTNREIAERLVISKRTADAHVEHILAKLGFSSRSQIAALISGQPLSSADRTP